MLTGFSYVRFTACSGYVSICFFLCHGYYGGKKPTAVSIENVVSMLI